MMAVMYIKEYCIPITDHRIPITAYSLLITIYRLPITYYKPASFDDKANRAVITSHFIAHDKTICYRSHKGI